MFIEGKKTYEPYGFNKNKGGGGGCSYKNYDSPTKLMKKQKNNSNIEKRKNKLNF